MDKYCNAFDVKFNPCEDFKTVHFKIQLDDLVDIKELEALKEIADTDDIICNGKHRFCENILNSSSYSTKSTIINIIIITLLIKLLYSPFNRDFYNC